MKTIFNIFQYIRGDYLGKLEADLQKRYGCKKVYLFSNARTAEYVFLNALNPQIDSEVIVQAFTCNAVINPILWHNLDPKYVDIEDRTFNMDLNLLKSELSRNTLAVIVQHTFGAPQNVRKVREIVGNKGIYILEDCAHALGNVNVGKEGDAAIVSFGIEKMLSTRVGGALLVNNDSLIHKIETMYSSMKYVNYIDTFKWLLNPIVWRILRKFGRLQMPIAKILNSLGLVNMGFYKSELTGIMPKKYPRRLSNALAKVAYDQIKEIDKNKEHRSTISRVYMKELSVSHGSDIPYVRFPLLLSSVAGRERIVEAGLKAGYMFGNWYDPLIYPSSTNIASMMYKMGSCPVAEDVSRRIVNLPTGQNISVEDAFRISKIVKSNIS